MKFKEKTITTFEILFELILRILLIPSVVVLFCFLVVIYFVDRSVYLIDLIRGRVGCK